MGVFGWERKAVARMRMVVTFWEDYLIHGSTLYSLMGLLLEMLVFLISLGVLTLGAQMITKGAVHIARAARVSEFLIGATVVAFGTSLPELASSLTAMLTGGGHPGIVIGNVVGSNLVNLGLGVGIGAAVFGFMLRRDVINIDLPFVIATGLALYASAQDGSISPLEGLLLLSLYPAYLLADMRSSGNGESSSEESFRLARVVQLLAGSAMVWISSTYLISSLITISEATGYAESLVSFLLLAVGTSLPEIVTATSAIRSGRADMAMGNLLGSCGFNVSVIVGLSSMLGNLSVHLDFMSFPMLALVLQSILFCFMSLNGRISRFEGLVMIITYLLIVVNLTWA